MAGTPSTTSTSRSSRRVKLLTWFTTITRARTRRRPGPVGSASSPSSTASTANGAAEHRRGRRRRHDGPRAAVLGDHPSPAHHLPRREPVQRVHDEVVGVVTGRDRAQVAEAQVARWPQGGRRQRVERVPPLRHRDLDQPAQVARGEAVRHDVVGDQQDATAVGERHDRRHHVGGQRLLLHHDPQPLAQLFMELGGRRQGVVGADAVGDVARQRRPRQRGHVPLEAEAGGRPGTHDRDQVRVAVDQALEVHDLAQRHHAGLARQRRDVLGPDRRVGRLDVGGGGGDAARHGRQHPQRQPLRRPHHPADARRAPARWRSRAGPAARWWCPTAAPPRRSAAA
jgi:hypothetical protein